MSNELKRRQQGHSLTVVVRLHEIFSNRSFDRRECTFNSYISPNQVDQPEREAIEHGKNGISP